MSDKVAMENVSFKEVKINARFISFLSVFPEMEAYYKNRYGEGQYAMFEVKEKFVNDRISLLKNDIIICKGNGSSYIDDISCIISITR
ncbi:MAG: hypothetical protein ACLVKO_07995 [Dysgonomonas sp.]